MALSKAEVAILLRAQDQASQALGKVEAALGRLGQASNRSGPGFLKLAGAVGLGVTAANAFIGVASRAADAVGGMVSKTAEFGTSMNVLEAVSGATAGEMDKLRKLAVDLGADLTLPATSAADAGKAMAELSKAGLSITDVMDAAKGTLQLAAAAQTDEAKAAQITAAALNTFGLSGRNATRVADMLATASNVSAAEITDLGQGLQQAGFAFKAVDRPIEELIASLALLTNAGLTGSDAGTALKNAIVRMVDPTKEAKAVMAELGISFFDVNGNLLPLPDIIDHLNDRLGGMTPEARNAALSTIFLSDGWKALQPLLDQGGDKLRKTIDQLGKQGAAADLAGAKTKGLGGAFDNFQSQVETLGITLGGKLSPALEGVVRFAGGFVGELNTALAGVDFSGVATAAETMRKDASDALYKAGQDVSAYGDTVLKHIPGVGPAFNTAAQTAGSALTGLAAILRGDPKGAVEAFGNAASTAAGGVRALGPAIEAAGQAAAGAATPINDWAAAVRNAQTAAAQQGSNKDFEQGLRNLGLAAYIAANGLRELFNTLTGRNKDIAESKDTFNLLTAAIQSQASQFRLFSEGAVNFADILVTSVRIVLIHLDRLRLAMQAVAQLAKGDLAGASESVSQAFARWGDANKEVEALFQRIQTRSSQTARTLDEQARDTWMRYPDVVEAGIGEAEVVIKNSTAEMRSATRESGAGIVAEAEAAMADAEAAVATGGQAIAAQARDDWARVASEVEGQASTVQQSAETAMAQVPVAVETNMAQAEQAATAGGQAVTDAIGTTTAQAVPKVQGTMQQVTAAVQGEAGAAYAAGASVGQSIVDGLVGALQAGQGPAAAAAAATVRAAIEAARGPQGADAHSPSRKTKQLGEDMWAGLNQALEAGKISPELLNQIREYVDAARDYVPFGHEIARVEEEIADIRERSATDALFRVADLIDVESELLRLKRDQIAAESELLPIRQALADAEREASRIEAGSLGDRTKTLELDRERAQIRLRIIDLERQLVGRGRDDKSAEGLRKELEGLRDKDRLLQLEQDRIRTTNQIAATGAKIRAEALGEQVTLAEDVIRPTLNQIAVLESLKAVYEANEAIIQNVTDNEVRQRERLIAVFKSEAEPLQERIQAGLDLIEQLEAEGVISGELANALKAAGQAALEGKQGAAVLQQAGQALSGALDKTAEQAAGAEGKIEDLRNINYEAEKGFDTATEGANQFREHLESLRDGVNNTTEAVERLAAALRDLPSGGGDLPGFAHGGRIRGGTLAMVGEQGPELFLAPSDGTILPAHVTRRLREGVGPVGAGADGGTTISAPATYYVNGVGVDEFAVRLAAMERRRQQRAALGIV